MKKENKSKKYHLHCLGKYDRLGFSMVEVLVASFLLIVGIFSVVSLLAKDMKQMVDSRNQVAASLLSEEGLELVRNLRDTNWANGVEAFSVERFPDGSQQDCIIDVDTVNAGLGDGDCNKDSSEQKLFYSDDQHIFTHNGSGAPTKFRRKLNLKYDNDPLELTATSFVLWGDKDISDPTECKLQNRCAYTQTILTSWNNAE